MCLRGRAILSPLNCGCDGVSVAAVAPSELVRRLRVWELLVSFLSGVADGTEEDGKWLEGPPPVAGEHVLTTGRALAKSRERGRPTPLTALPRHALALIEPRLFLKAAAGAASAPRGVAEGEPAPDGGAELRALVASADAAWAAWRGLARATHAVGRLLSVNYLELLFKPFARQWPGTPLGALGDARLSGLFEFGGDGGARARERALRAACAAVTAAVTAALSLIHI